MSFVDFRLRDSETDFKLRLEQTRMEAEKGFASWKDKLNQMQSTIELLEEEKQRLEATAAAAETRADVQVNTELAPSMSQGCGSHVSESSFCMNGCMNES